MVQDQDKASAKQKAYEYIKSGIINLRFPEGSFLMETEIGKSLGISRTPVREAFLLLEAENLLQLVPQKGAFVPPVSIRELEELIETRALIEAFASERVVQPIHAETVRDLRRVLERQEQVVRADDTPLFLDLDRDFHRLIVRASGNSLLSRVYHGLGDRQMRMGTRALYALPGRMQQVLVEHSAIVAAAERRDAAELKASILSHLDSTLAVLKSRPYA